MRATVFVLVCACVVPGCERAPWVADPVSEALLGDPLPELPPDWATGSAQAAILTFDDGTFELSALGLEGPAGYVFRAEGQALELIVHVSDLHIGDDTWALGVPFALGPRLGHAGWGRISIQRTTEPPVTVADPATLCSATYEDRCAALKEKLLQDLNEAGGMGLDLDAIECTYAKSVRLPPGSCPRGAEKPVLAPGLYALQRDYQLQLPGGGVTTLPFTFGHMLNGAPDLVVAPTFEPIDPFDPVAPWETRFMGGQELVSLPAGLDYPVAPGWGGLHLAAAPETEFPAEFAQGRYSCPPVDPDLGPEIFYDAAASAIGASAEAPAQRIPVAFTSSGSCEEVARCELGERGCS